MGTLCKGRAAVDFLPVLLWTFDIFGQAVRTAPSHRAFSALGKTEQLFADTL